MTVSSTSVISAFCFCLVTRPRRTAPTGRGDSRSEDPSRRVSSVRAGLAFCQYAVQAAGRGLIARRLGLGDHLRQRPDLREAWFSDFAHGTEDVAAYWHGSQPPQTTSAIWTRCAVAWILTTCRTDDGGFRRPAAALPAGRLRNVGGRRPYTCCSPRLRAFCRTVVAWRQRDCDQPDGDEKPQQHRGPMPAQPSAQPARAPSTTIRRGLRLRSRRSVADGRIGWISSRSGISSPDASRLNMPSREASPGSDSASPSSMDSRACCSRALRLIAATPPPMFGGCRGCSLLGR